MSMKAVSVVFKIFNHIFKKFLKDRESKPTEKLKKIDLQPYLYLDSPTVTIRCICFNTFHAHLYIF